MQKYKNLRNDEKKIKNMRAINSQAYIKRTSSIQEAFNETSQNKQILRSRNKRNGAVKPV